jgi:hypothetical protein
MLFDGVGREQVGALGDVRRPSIADLFVAVMGHGGQLTNQGVGQQGKGELR